MDRTELLERLATIIAAVERSHPVRVVIDGIDAAGKTTLADELVAPVMARGHPVIRASIAGFHRPREERYRLGRDSPEGYYRDSFDHDAVRSLLLCPLDPGGDRRYRRRAFDYRTDQPIAALERVAPDNAVLLFDGVFCFRPELNDYWDLRVLVEVDFNEAIRRAVRRDSRVDDDLQEIERRYRTRYLPGQQFYRSTVRPRELADIVIDNTNTARPRLWLRSDAS